MEERRQGKQCAAGLPQSGLVCLPIDCHAVPMQDDDAMARSAANIFFFEERSSSKDLR